MPGTTLNGANATPAALAVTVALASLACHATPTAIPPDEPEPETRPIETDESSRSVDAGPRDGPQWRIHERGVGTFVVGGPLPDSALDADLADRHHTSLFADAQPLEGFRFDSPPLTAMVVGGPFHAFAMERLGEPVPATMAAEAARLARERRLEVSMIIVSSPEPRTDAGVGFGSQVAELRAAYPDIALHRLPGMWEEPSCIFESKSLPRVHFFIAECGGSSSAIADENARVIRVVVTQ